MNTQTQFLQQYKVYFLTACVVGILFLLFSSSAHAATATVIDSPPIKFTPQISIPFTDVKAGVPIAMSPQTINTFIVGLYRFLVFFSSFLAVFMITLAGFKWMIARGDKGEIGAAKKTMINAIIGLILALLSFSILNVINPDLVVLPDISIGTVASIEQDFDFGGDLPSSNYTKGQSPVAPGYIPSSGPITCATSSNAPTSRDAKIDAVVALVSKIQTKTVSYVLGGTSASECLYYDANAGKRVKLTDVDKNTLCFDCSGFVSFIHQCATGMFVSPGADYLFSTGTPSGFEKIAASVDAQGNLNTKKGDIIGWSSFIPTGKDCSGGGGHAMYMISDTQFVDVHGGSKKYYDGTGVHPGNLGVAMQGRPSDIAGYYNSWCKQRRDSFTILRMK